MLVETNQINFESIKNYFHIEKWSPEKLKKKFNIDYNPIMNNNMFGIMTTDIEAEIYFEIVDLDKKPIDKHLACTIQFQDKEQAEKFRYYVSRERHSYIKKEIKKRYIQKLKAFEEEFINPDEFMQFIEKLTKEFFVDLLQDVSCLNIKKLAQDAKIYFIRSIYDYSLKDKHDVKDIQETMFYEYYPCFKKFAMLVGELSSDYNEQLLGGSHMEELNYTYGSKLVEYALIHRLKANPIF